MAVRTKGPGFINTEINNDLLLYEYLKVLRALEVLFCRTDKLKTVSQEID